MWEQDCQRSFDKIKAVLTNYPRLTTPDFNKQFKLAVDASDVGVGVVMFQDEEGIKHTCA